jgi:hypothetical protein
MHTTKTASADSFQMPEQTMTTVIYSITTGLRAILRGILGRILPENVPAEMPAMPV